MAAVLGAVVALRFALNSFRSDWFAPQVWLSQGDAPRREIGSGWSTGEFGLVDAAGRKHAIADACPWGEGLPDLKTCMAQKGFTGRYRTVYPSSDFWSFQWIETGIFLGLAAEVEVLAEQDADPEPADLAVERGVVGDTDAAARVAEVERHARRRVGARMRRSGEHEHDGERGPGAHATMIAGRRGPCPSDRLPES